VLASLRLPGTDATTPPMRVPPLAEAAVAARLPGVAGDRYTSPSHGYALAWDGGWWVAGASAEGGADAVVLGNGTSEVAIESGEAARITPASCIGEVTDALRGDPRYTDFALAQDAEGEPRRGTDANGAFSVFTYTFTAEGAEPEAQTLYVACRPLVAGESFLRIRHAAPADAFDEQVAARDDLLSALTLPGAAPAAVPSPAATPAAAPTEEKTDP
jgi:hypothetical protein